MTAGIILMLSSSLSHSSAKIPSSVDFELIEGDHININDLNGKVVLITNTASKCGFTSQYDGLQQIYDRYNSSGLEIIAVPSNDFLQEYSSEEKVKNFCETNFGITFPITTVTKITGRNAHPFYLWLKENHNFKPRWNFNKILIDKNGRVIETFGSVIGPNSKKLTSKIEMLLNEY